MLLFPRGLCEIPSLSEDLRHPKAAAHGRYGKIYCLEMSHSRPDPGFGR